MSYSEVVKLLSRVQLFVTPWTVAYQAPVHGIFQATVLDSVHTAVRELRENAKSENLVQLEQIKFWQTQYFASKKLFGVTVLFLKYWITMEILKENICLLKYLIIFIILWAFYVMKEFAWIFFLKYSFGSVQSLSHVQLLRHQPTRLLHPWDFQARVLEWGAIAFSESLG